MAWRKSPEEKAAEAERELRAEEDRLAAKQAKRFARTPVGQARAAHADGLTLFQTSLNLRGATTDLVPLGPSLDDDESDDPNDVLNGVEAEGWDLHSAGFVFISELEQHEEKFLAGQLTTVNGRTVGYYVFQRRELD